jgi:hypothetical protein
MLYRSFKSIAQKLQRGIIQLLHMKKRRNRSSSTGNSNNYRRYVPNGPITPSVRLACALCYFAGGSPCDFMTTYCIGYTGMMQSIWYVVDAIHAHSDFKILYPICREEQHAIAESFGKKSVACFPCCVGAIDGILVWIHKPTEVDCAKAGCSSGKNFC